jgi:acetyl-CoA C-acetyltransferase
MTILDKDEFVRPNTTMEGLAQLKPAFETLGAMGFDAVALSKYPQLMSINHVHHAGNKQRGHPLKGKTREKTY